MSEYQMPGDVMPEEPPMPLSDFFAKQLGEVSTRGDGLLGMNLTRLAQMATTLDGIQPGMYAIVAPSNVGKTALMTSICGDLLDTNPEAVGVFFSFDDPKKVIVNRFVGIETRIPLNKLLRRLGPGDQEARHAAYQKLIALANAGRLMLKDIGEVNTVEAMEKEIREAVGRGGKVFVVADGLQNLCGDFDAGSREFHIRLANRIKAIVDRFDLPLIATLEVRKKGRNEPESKGYSLHDVMETGKYTYNSSAGMVLEDDSEGATDEEAMLPPTDINSYMRAPDTTLSLRIEKNKLSGFKGVLKLRFQRYCGLVRCEEPAYARGVAQGALPQQDHVQNWGNN